MSTTSAAVAAAAMAKPSKARSRRGKTGQKPVVIMGAGRLGEALLLTAFPSLLVVAIFDMDPKRIGKQVLTRPPASPLVVEPTVALASRVHSHNVQRGIIAVPANTAQQAADALVGAGIKVILNYAAAEVCVPKDVLVSCIPDPASQFARMDFVTRGSGLPWKACPQQQQSSSPALVRLPQMWTTVTHSSLHDGSLGNPLLLLLRTAQEEEEDYVREDGFFEFTQHLLQQRAQPASASVLPQQQHLIGLDEELELVRETLSLRDAAVRTRGILLWGPAGCGKSALLHKLKTSFDMRVVSNGEEGTLAHAFADAPSKASAAVVVVIENLHLACKSRAFKTMLLAICDDARYDSISLVGTTNAPWALDANLLRHFETRVHVRLPNQATRVRVLERHFATLPLAMNARDFECVSRMLDGHSTWDVITAAKAAALLARKSAQPISRAHFLPNATQSTVCHEFAPLYDAFAKRFSSNNSTSQHSSFQSMYS